MLTTRDLTSSSGNGTTPEQVTLWWQRAKEAVDAQQLDRARRYLRWILAAYPDNESAWLWLARLAPNHGARMAYLHQAQAFHPNSKRVHESLRQARTLQLESITRDLGPSPGGLARLPRRPGPRPRPGAKQRIGHAWQTTLARLNKHPAVQTMSRLARTLPAEMAALVPAPPRLPARPSTGELGDHTTANWSALEIDKAGLLGQIQGLIQVGERFAIFHTVGPQADSEHGPDVQTMLQAFAFERWLVEYQESARIEIYIRVESRAK